MTPPGPHPFDFFGRLRWLDGRPLMDTVEHYRRETFEQVLFTFDPDGRPRYDRALIGRAKKNNKSSDLILAALYRLLAWEAPAGNDAYILANDEGQATDDLVLAKKLIATNPILAAEVELKQKEIARRDGRGTLKVLPAQDIAGSHGKTFLFCGYDEIHPYKDYGLFEALSPDPTRRDVLVWITSYNTMRFAPGVPLHDLMQLGRAGTDDRMFFSWYAADFTTDPALAGEEVSPEERANPSMSSWDNPNYLDDQRCRLPAHRFRRLHLNLPGMPDGAAFSGEHVLAAVARGRRRLPRAAGVRYFGFVDMSSGSNDDAALALAHRDKAGRIIVDLVVTQNGRPPFNARHAVAKFAGILREYGISTVQGDAFGGLTYRQDFAGYGIGYTVAAPSTSDLYEALDPRITAGEVELPDEPRLTEQLLTLVWRGSKIDHLSGAHDDLACAAAGAVWLADARHGPMIITREMIARASRPSPYLHRYG
jgi:hypothetical protein